MHCRRASGLSLVFVLVLPGTIGASSTPSVTECRRLYAARPADEEGIACLYDQGSEGRQLLEPLYNQHSERPWLALYLGYTLRQKDPARAARLYRQATDRFTARGAFTGAFSAWADLAFLARRAGRFDEAEVDSAAALAVSGASGDRELILKGKVLEAQNLLSRDHFERAYRLLKEIEPEVNRRRDYKLEKPWLTALGNSALPLGRHREAREAYLRLADTALVNHDSYAEANALYNLAHLAINELADEPSEEAREEVRNLAQRTLAVAGAAWHQEDEVDASWILGMLTKGEEAIGHLRRCRLIAKAPREICYCSCALALRLANRDPRQAEQLAEKGAAAALEAGDSKTQAYALWAGVRVSWASQRSAQMTAAWTAALKANDRLRIQQPSQLSQAEVQASWSADPYWLSGSLLERQDKADAFDIIEQERWRTLLDALAHADVGPRATTAAEERQEARARILTEIAATTKILLDPSLPPVVRRVKSAYRQELERREKDLRERVAERQLAPADEHFASLRAVQDSLAADQALFSFQVAPDASWDGDFGGGSWLLAITRGGARVYRLRDRVALSPAVQNFLGLLQRHDGQEREPAAALYRHLVGPALHDLPHGIQRLIIVPDGALHQLPFGVLRATHDGAPLAELYQISLVPSATLWRRWREKRPTAETEDTVLVLANPRISNEKLGPLPYAQQEGRAALAALGGGRLLTGERASGEALQNAPIERFGIVAFATHSSIDEESPDDSGVLLSPSPGSPDGRLPLRDIVKLHLEGKLVILASCSSARGIVLPGEGVMGLARAFFQAGAQAVVGSLWPVQDEETALFFERFYVYIAAGKSVAAALSAAQRDRIAAGAPPSAWAAFVVLGDGDLVPFPHGRQTAWLAPGLAIAGILALVLWVFHQRARIHV